MTPSSIGRYEIENELGRGGMAVVYLAHDPYIKRQVAIKVLPRQFTFDPQFRTRFQREAEVIAALEHPFIVPIHDFGEHDDQPFLVMRLMLGGDLSDRIKQDPLPLAETAVIIERMGAALDRAHSQGIIHRDLKPGNILFDQYDDPFLSDFGIARLAESTATLTGTGGIVGTPTYMSPEQIHGDMELDGRSDVYALGVIVFQLLTGQTPYQAKTPSKQMMQHVMEPVPQILAVNSDLPSGCETIIAQAMAKDRDDRFATGGELAAALTTVAREAETQEITPSATLVSTTTPPETVITPPGLKPPGWEEAERAAIEKAEAERIATEKAEAERIAAEKAEAERIAAEKAEAERIAAEKAEAERIAAEKAEAERIATEKAKAERIAAEKAETEQQAKEEKEHVVPVVVGASSQEISVAEEIQVTPAPVGAKTMPKTLLGIGAAVLLLLLVGGGIIISSVGSGSDGSTLEKATPDQTEVAAGSVGDAPTSPTATNTPISTATRTPTPRATLIPTATQPAPAAVPADDTPTPTPTSTSIPLPVETPTPIPSTDTPTPALLTNTPTPTAMPASQVELLHTLVTLTTDKLGEFISSRIARGEIPGVASVSFSPDGNTLVTGGNYVPPVQLWRVSDGERVGTLEWAGHGPRLTIISPDGKLLAGGLRGGLAQVLLWRAPDWAEYRILEGYQETAGASNSLAFSPDGTILAGGCSDGIVRLWQVTEDGPVTPIQTFPGFRAAFSPDGQLLATTQADSTVQILQPFGGGVLHTLAGHTAEANTVAFSPDGTLLASGGRDNTIRLWQVSDGTLVDTFEGHTGPVESVAFSPDGTTLASGSQDASVRLWSVADGTPLNTLEDHGIMVYSVAFSSQGVLASGAADGTVKLWRVQ